MDLCGDNFVLRTYKPIYLVAQDEDIMDFITSFDKTQQAIWVVFHLSVWSLIGAVLVIVHYHYNAHVRWIITVFTIVCAAAVMYGCATVSNRSQPQSASNRLRKNAKIERCTAI